LPLEMKALQKFFEEKKAAPDYTRMNKTKTLNVRLYNPLDPQDTAQRFEGEGYTKTRKDGLNIFTKNINGITVTIYQEPSGDPNNYGTIFREIAAPDIDMIAYSGHTGMGTSLTFAFDQAPRMNILQMEEKIICILSCYSGQVYLSSILQHFPLSHFIGTKTRSSTTEDADTLITILDGMTERLSWIQIEERVKKKAVNVGYLFPHSPERKDYIDASASVMSDNGIYLPSGGYLLAQERDSFDFEPGNVDLTRFISSGVREVSDRVKYFFSFNDYLKEFSTNITASGLRAPYDDSENAVLGLTLRPRHKDQGVTFGINAGYRNTSQAVLSMMCLHELNMYFSRIKAGNSTGQWMPDAYDNLRSLQMAAEFVKYYHKEGLFPGFLQKYRFPAGISLEKLLKTLDSYSNEERVKALKEILSLLDYRQETDENELKSHGLLSYNFLHDFDLMIAGDATPFWFYNGDWATPSAASAFPSISSTGVGDEQQSNRNTYAKAQEQKPPSSSAVENGLGGIDFRNLPIVTQAITNLHVGIDRLPLDRLKAINLGSEWQQIEHLVNSGITPSTERIKEFVQASAIQGELDSDMSKVVLCIADIFKLEEERCSYSDPALKDILIVLESGKNAQELKEIFTADII